MLFHETSASLKIAIGVSWVFPYLVLAVLTRSWRRWAEELTSSALTPVLFSLSFVLMCLLFSNFDYATRGLMPVEQMLSQSVLVSVLIFPWLPLIIIGGILVAIFRPSFPYNLLAGLSSGILHLLYLFSVMIQIFELDRQF